MTNYCPCGRRCRGDFCGICASRARQKGKARPVPTHCTFCGAPFPDLGLRVYRNKRYCDWRCQQGAKRMGKGKMCDDMPAELIERMIELHYQRIQRERRRATTCE